MESKKFILSKQLLENFKAYKLNPDTNLKLNLKSKNFFKEMDTTFKILLKDEGPIKQQKEPS